MNHAVSADSLGLAHEKERQRETHTDIRTLEPVICPDLIESLAAALRHTHSTRVSEQTYTYKERPRSTAFRSACEFLDQFRIDSSVAEVQFAEFQRLLDVIHT